MNRLLIVRHGTTDWNEKHLFQGSKDIELNETGINEIKKLRDIIDLNKIDLCISSSLKRASRSAKIITQGKIDIIYDDLLRERGFGDYEGTPSNNDLIVKHWDYKLNDSSHNIESIKECLDRAKIFLDNISKSYQDKTILIVTHACIIKAIHFNIVGYDENTDFLSFYPKNAKLYEYEIK